LAATGSSSIAWSRQQSFALKQGLALKQNFFVYCKPLPGGRERFGRTGQDSLVTI